MRSISAAFATAVVLGCATTPGVSPTDARTHVAEARTMRSEADVRSCAEARTGIASRQGLVSAVGRSGAATENTAYGRGPVSDVVSFTTARTGAHTVLTVYARSYVLPTSGRGEANSNSVEIPATAGAKALADALILSCAGSA